jgi:energy-coupling factor transporter transmembrane protein EcfT
MTDVSSTKGRSRPTELHLLRHVPGDTPVHRLWAGTKLLAVAGVSVVLSLRPTWPVALLVAVALAATLRLARIPRGAAPRLPRWFWASIVAAVAFSGLSGWSGVADWGRFLLVAADFVVAAALVGWTTPLADVAPALAALARPLRRLRLPVDEWLATVALGIRCLPLLTDEARVLVAARRLRRPAQPPPWRARLREPVDLLTAALVVSVRRSHELADAIEARGGLATVVADPAGRRLRRLDAAALAAVLALAAAAFLLPR